jgi:hypothetical protein
MAISATFKADFADFQRAAQEATTKLVTFETGAAKAAAALGRMETSLSGKKLIQDATLMAQAVENIGGISKLTGDELQKVGAQAQAAADKMIRMGLEVPPKIQNIADAAKAAEAALEKVTTTTGGTSKAAAFLGSTFTQVFGALSVSGLVNKAVGALTDLATQAVASAGALVDLSNKTGLSTETIQRMQFVAKQSGTDMQTFADAAFKMGVNISEGTKKAREGAEALGLDWQKLRAASPDDQFNMVVQALEAMEDPQKRNAAAVALFGKTAKEILPAIVDGYTRVAKEATVAGDAQIKALDAAGDAWDRFKARSVTSMVQFLGSVAQVHEASNALTEDEKTFAREALAVTQRIEDVAAAYIKLANAKGLAGGKGDIKLPSEVKPPTSTASFSDDLKAAEAGYRALTAAQLAELDAALKLGKSNDDIINQLNITDGVLSVAKKAFEEHKTAVTKAADAAKAWAKVLAEIQSVGENYRKTILTIDGAVVVWATHLLKSGADAKTVAEYYHLTESQVKALQQAIKDDTDAEKTLSEIRNKLEAGTLDLNEALKRVNSTELIAIKEHLDLAKAMQMVEKSIPPVVAGFHGLGEDITHVGLKSTELDQLVVHLKGVDRAADEARKHLVGMWEIAGSINDAVQSLDLGDSELGKIAHQFDGIASAAINAAKAIAQFGADSAQAGSSVVGLAVAWYNFWAAKAAADNQDHARADERATDTALANKFGLTAPANFSEGLRRQLFSEANDLESSYVSSAASHINDIVKELGGWARLTAAQLKTVQEQIDGFNTTLTTSSGLTHMAAVATGLMAMAQSQGAEGFEATKQLDQALVDMGITAVTTGGLVDKFFLDETAKAKRLGIDLKQVAEFQASQAKAAETGIVGALTITNDAWAKRKILQDQVAQATTDLAGKSGSALVDQQAKLADLNAQLLTQQHIIDATGVHSQAAAGAMSGALLGVISSQVAAGMSFGDAIRQVAPGITSLRDQLNAMGIGGGDAFDFLNQQVGLFTGEVTGPALKAIEGYAQGLVGLHNAGQLNQDTFAGITEQIGKTEQALEAQGVNGPALIRAMQGPLQKIWELEEKFGYKADAATQALIDQALAVGEVGEAHKSVSDQMLDATTRIADAVEGLAAVFGVLPKAAKDAAGGMSDELGKIKIPSITIPVGFLKGGETGADDYPYHLHTDNGGAQAAGGDYMVSKPTLFLAGEAGAERATFTPIGQKTQTSAGSTVVLQEEFTFHTTITAIDGASLAEFTERKLMPQIIGQIEDHRRGFTGRIRQALEIPVANWKAY